MGGTALHDATSLARLKALDSLSTVDVQLQEAQKLCNHSARAEMLLRWLVTRLKLSSPTRLHSGSWNLFASCVRLLPVQRIAAILGSGALHEVLQTTCAEQSIPKDTLSAIWHSWELLHAMSLAPAGAAVMALLRVDGVLAAEICGHWFEHVYRVLQEDDAAATAAVDRLLLNLGVQLWTARKRSSSDDTAFSSKAVVSACRILVLLGKGDERTATKRKRATCALEPTQDHMHALESLVAKHTVLPARASFLATRQQEAGHRKQPPKTGQQLAGVFDALKTSMQDAHEVVPVVLDIALRAVSMPTPGQRNRELPWIETMFEALSEHLNLDDYRQHDEAITAMLHCLAENKVTLSSQKLCGLVKNALVASEPPRGVSWRIIAEIVSLNSGIFTDVAIATELFAAIGARQMSTTANDSIVKDRIIVQIIDAFFQKQQTKDFLALWHLQLQSNVDNQAAEVWSAVVPDVVDAISSLLDADIALSALTEHFVLLQQLAVREERDIIQDDTRRRLRADLVVLRTVFQGLRNGGRVDEHLERSLATLRSLDTSHLHVDCRRELWQFFTVVFEQWLPSWVNAQSDHAAVAAYLTGLVKSDILTMAMKDAQSASCATSAAQVLLGCVHSMGQPYITDGKRAALRPRVVEMLCTQPQSGLSVLAEYPKLLVGLPSASADQVLKTAVSHRAHDGYSDETIRNADSVIPRVLANIMSAVKHKGDMDKWLATLNVSQYALLVPAALGMHERGIVLNRLLSQKSDCPSAGSLEQLSALVLSWLMYPVEDSQLLNLAPTLFNLAFLWAPRTEPTEPSASLQHLPSIVRALFRHLSSAKAQHQRKELSRAATEHIRTWEAGTGGVTNTFASDALILLVCTTIACFEESNSSESEPYAHHDKKVLRALVEHLVTQFEGTQADLAGRKSGLSPINYSAAGDGLLILPESVWKLVGSKRKTFIGRLVKAAKDILLSDNSSSAVLKSTSFKLLCRYDAGSDLTETAAQILSRSNTAKDERLVLRWFEESLGTEVSVDAIANIIRSGPPKSLAVAQLNGCMIKKWAKSSVETPATFSANDVWHYLLRTLSETDDGGIQSEALSLIETLAAQKKHIVSQYGLEQSLNVMHQVMSRSSQAEEAFSGVCQVLKVILNQYRTQLQGRFHLVTALFQTLLTSLLDETSATAAPLQIRQRHAKNVAHLLEMFCKPVWVRNTATTNLVDHSRETQKYAGQFVHYILHHYCSQVLASNPAETIRVAIRPGIFAICEAMEAHDEARMRSLSAAMNANERAILRIVVSDWRQFGKWEGK